MEDVDPYHAASPASPGQSSSGSSSHDGSDLGDDPVGGLAAEDIVDDVGFGGMFNLVGDAWSVVDLVAGLLDLDQDMVDPPPADVAADFAAIGLPVYDPITCQVVRPGGVVLGRIKPMHVGTAKAAQSVYCRMHGCAPPLQRRAQAFTVEQLLQWFHDGEELPTSYAQKAQSKADHLRMFRKIGRDG
jgi:hypothetical protein